jgi:hypothetical protein
MTEREIEMDDVNVLVVTVEEAQEAQNAREIQRENLRSIVIAGHLNVEKPTEIGIQPDHRQLVISSQVEIMELPVMLLETLAKILLERVSGTVAEMSPETAVEIVSGKVTERLADVMEENGNLSEMHTKVPGMQSAEERGGQKEAMRGVQREAQIEEVTGEAETCEEKLVVKSDVTAAEAEAEKTEVQAESGGAMKGWTRGVMTRDREEDKFASRWWEA